MKKSTTKKTYVLTDHFISGEIFLHEDDTGKVTCDFTKCDARASQITFLLRAAEGGMENLRRSLSAYSNVRQLI